MSVKTAAVQPGVARNNNSGPKKVFGSAERRLPRRDFLKNMLGGAVGAGTAGITLAGPSKTAEAAEPGGDFGNKTTSRRTSSKSDKVQEAKFLLRMVRDGQILKLTPGQAINILENGLGVIPTSETTTQIMKAKIESLKSTNVKYPLSYVMGLDKMINPEYYEDGGFSRINQPIITKRDALEPFVNHPSLMPPLKALARLNTFIEKHNLDLARAKSKANNYSSQLANMASSVAMK